MVKLTDDIDMERFALSFSEESEIDVGIPAENLVPTDYSQVLSEYNATSVEAIVAHQMAPVISADYKRFMMHFVDADEDGDYNSSGIADSGRDEETDAQKAYRIRQEMVENSLGARRPSYVSTFVPVINLSSASIREVSAEEGHADGCTHSFNGVAKDHVDVEGNEIRVHRVEKNVDPDTRETAQELIEDAKEKGQIVATGDLADNDTLCETDPKSEVCTTSPLKLGL